MKAPREHLLTAREIADGPRLTVSHPLRREASEVEIRPLGERVGLSRVRVSLLRLPPGKEAFAFHAHQGDEEFAFIVGGRGEALIGSERFEVGPGDFLAFPTPPTSSVGHQLRNPFDEDLVYLVGGERGRIEVAEFAAAGKHAIFTADGVYFVDSRHLEKASFEDYLKKP
jgi:uncharacterized cupin superfamily protein